MKICFISRFDSFVQLALNYAIQFKKHNWEVVFIVLKKNKLSSYQFSYLKKQLRVHEIELENYKKEKLLSSTVVFFCLTGGYIKKIIKNNLLSVKKDRPYLISAYPGVVYQNIYDGFTSRSLCDLIILPSFKEKVCYDRYCDEYCLTNAGIVGGYFKKHQYNGNNFTNDIIFAEQTVVPNTISDRLYLAKKLVEFAEKNPKRKLFIKPRIPLSGSALFETKLHIQDALSAVANNKLPSNLKITYKPIEYYTSQGAACVTISSTAAIETLQFHDRIIFISDFGPSENNGGTYFRNSNLVSSFSELISGNSKKINEEWKRQVYISNDECIDNILERISLDIGRNSRAGYDNSRKLYSSEYLSEPKIKVELRFQFLKFIKIKIVKTIDCIKKFL